MKETLELINRMQADGVIGKYAIGGAVGATYYLEPVVTLDIDIFVVLPETSSGLITLSPIYEYLGKFGWKPREEYVDIAGWPVQFLPPADALELEALEQANNGRLGEVPIRVMTPEHLIALSLKTGRPKDHTRIVQFFSEKAFNEEKLAAILKRHGMIDRWQRFKEKYIGE